MSPIVPGSDPQRRHPDRRSASTPLVLPPRVLTRFAGSAIPACPCLPENAALQRSARSATNLASRGPKAKNSPPAAVHRDHQPARMSPALPAVPLRQAEKENVGHPQQVRPPTVPAAKVQEIVRHAPTARVPLVQGQPLPERLVSGLDTPRPPPPKSDRAAKAQSPAKAQAALRRAAGFLEPVPETVAMSGHAVTPPPAAKADSRARPAVHPPGPAVETLRIVAPGPQQDRAAHPAPSGPVLKAAAVPPSTVPAQTVPAQIVHRAHSRNPLAASSLPGMRELAAQVPSAHPAHRS